jgi:ABC-type amino acid transport substrate-binding protein
MDAAVYDAPMLRHLISAPFDQYLDVLPIRFMPQNYAVALPDDSRYREPINRAILAVCSGDDWERLRFRYLGE